MNPAFRDPFAAFLAVAAACVAFALAGVSVVRVYRFRDVRSRTELLMGISLAAGSLGWSLGHNDFAPRGEETRYMALHVTLTGLRGLLAPPVAILAYYGLRRLSPGIETWSMSLPVGLIVSGAWQITAMRRDHGAGGPVRT